MDAEERAHRPTQRKGMRVHLTHARSPRHPVSHGPASPEGTQRAQSQGLEPPVKRDSHRLQAEKGTRANPGHQGLVMYGDSVDPPQRQLRNSPGGAGGYQLAFTSCGEEPGSSYSENHKKQSPHGYPDNLTGQAISKRCVPLKRGFQGQKGTEHTYHRHPMGL